MAISASAPPPLPAAETRDFQVSRNSLTMSVPALISVFENLDDGAEVWSSAAVDTCQHAGYLGYRI